MNIYRAEITDLSDRTYPPDGARSCSVRLDFSSAKLPAGLKVSMRGYDASERVKFSGDDVSENETVEMDDCVTMLVGLVMKQDGEILGYFAESPILKPGGGGTVIAPVLTSPLRRRAG